MTKTVIPVTKNFGFIALKRNDMQPVFRWAKTFRTPIILHDQIYYICNKIANKMGKLYLIPTPVGNMEDITLRALRLLKEVDLILAEDTRTSAKLLRHYGIATPLLSHHKFNEHQQVDRIAERIGKGENIALISDAGTPGISDPGFLLTRKCVEKGIETECLPGATAFVPALVNSGLPCDRFCFEGFLPQKKGRQKKLNALDAEERTMIFYESPYRLTKTLEQMSCVFGPGRYACVAREISKVFEEFRRGTLSELSAYYSQNTAKGEIVLMVAGKEYNAGENVTIQIEEEEEEE